MNSTAWFRRALWLGMFGIAALAAAPLRADEKPPEGAPVAKDPQAAPPADAPQRGPGRFLGRYTPAKYILDMHLAPVPPVLNDQLDLKGEGVVVVHVGPGGPADKAGIKANDLVMAVGDKPIKSMPDLMEAVDKSEGKELSLKLLRAGKPITVAVTPAEPPKLERLVVPFGRGKLSPEVMKEIKELQAKIREKLKDAGVDMRMEFNMPSFDFNPDAPRGPGFGPGGPYRILPDEPEHLGRRPLYPPRHPDGPPPGADGPPPHHPDGPPHAGRPHGPDGPDGPPHAGPDHRGHHSLRAVEHRLSEMGREMHRMHQQIEELRRMLHEERDNDDRDGDDRDDGDRDDVRGDAPPGDQPPQ